MFSIDLKEHIRGKVVPDPCNPSGGSNNALAREAEANGVAQTSAKYLPDTRLVRAFSAVDATAIEASANRQSGKLGVPRDDPGRAGTRDRHPGR